MPSALSSLSMDDLRQERLRERRRLEVAQMRSRSGGSESDVEVIALLRLRVDALTDELIRRYAEDLALVDSLLSSAYPQGGAPGAASTEGGAAR